MRFGHWMAAGLFSCALLACSTSRPPPLELLGQPAPLAAAQRSIVLTPDTPWVNVEGGEIIAFHFGEHDFVWHFFVGSTVSSFPLNRVAPSGMLPRTVMVYVAPDPRYRDLEGWR